MAFEAKDYAISDILNKSVFDIPRNQRRYVWKKPHWQDLYEDIGFSITKTKPHFVGSIVLEGEGKRMAFHITLSLMDSNDLPQ